MSKMIKAAWSAVILTGVFLGILLYWSILPLNPVIEITNIAAEQKNNNLHLEYDYCKNSDNKGFITRYFKDDILYYMANIYSNAEVGCGHAKQVIDIPENLPTDEYTFNFEITYKVSPIKEKTYRFQTNKFEVKQ